MNFGFDFIFLTKKEQSINKWGIRWEKKGREKESILEISQAQMPYSKAAEAYYLSPNSYEYEWLCTHSMRDDVNDLRFL